MTELIEKYTVGEAEWINDEFISNGFYALVEIKN